jgi:hypothetical protein
MLCITPGGPVRSVPGPDKAGHGSCGNSPSISREHDHLRRCLIQFNLSPSTHPVRFITLICNMSPLLSHIFILSLALQAHTHPLSCFLFRKASTAVQNFQDQSWLWGWAWGTDSVVSVVDRSPPVTFPSRPAGFGADLADPLLGYVIPLNSFTVPCSNGTAASQVDSPNLGCPSLCSIDPNIPERLEPWIALVQRGACQFVFKAREAQRLGAKAIVVGGEDPDISGKPDTLVNMFSPGDVPQFA